MRSGYLSTGAGLRGPRETYSHSELDLVQDLRNGTRCLDPRPA